MSQQITPTSPELRRAVREALSSVVGKMGVEDYEAAEFAALSQYQPPTRALANRGIGFAQSAFIGTMLAPEITATPDGSEQASYPVWGKEAFFTGDSDIVGVSGDTKRADLALTWVPITLDVHAKEVYVDPREERAAGAAALSVVPRKTELARMQVEGKKEVTIAAKFLAEASYKDNTYYATLGGATQWSNAASTPIAAIVAQIEALRKVNGVRPNTLWLSPNAYRALRFHPNITALTQYTGTRANPNTPAGLDTLSAIFGLTVVVGEAVNTTTIGGAFADVWGDKAGLTYVGGANLYEPQFAATLVAGGFPKVLAFRSNTEGAEGSDCYRYMDAYAVVVMLNTAGYLWEVVTGY